MMGGLGLAFGMTVAAGLFSMAFSQFLKYFRSLFPVEGDSPSPGELLADGDAALRHAGMLIRQYADRLSFGVRVGRQHIALHFDH